jgi:MoaA/NifB/PqqE/SkfB family radical SAM enzyme
MKLPSITSIGNYFSKYIPRNEKKECRPFNVAQIEITSRCSTGCVFCPYVALTAKWLEGDMKLDTYNQHIVPHLDLFDLAYLQGWGEPMLHPGLWDMLTLAQKKGCRTGFTTNGTWLKDGQNKKLLELGVDLISVSFAGADGSTHKSLRTNSDFSHLCANFESLANLKEQRGCTKPWLELHFLMMRANLSEFPALVELAASIGANEVVATNLAFSPKLALENQHVFGNQPLPEDVEITKHAREVAAQLNIPLRIYPLQTEQNTLVCDADPLNSIYINQTGDVSPCVYSGLSLQGEIPRFYQGEYHPFEPIRFGNVCDGLLQVLESKERNNFLNVFKRRNVSSDLVSNFTYMIQQNDEYELPPPPVPCDFCYKMLGI